MVLLLDIMYQIILLFFLLILSAFFSAAEIALFSIGRIGKHKLMKEKAKNADVIEKLLDDPNRLLVTILFGNNLVNVSASALATSVSMYLFGSLGVGIAVGVMTFLILLFGEIVPKSYAVHNKEKFASFAAKPIYFMQTTQAPYLKLLSALINKLMNYYGLSNKEMSLVTEEEVKSAVVAGMEDGSIDPDEKELIHNVFEFDDTEVKSVMVPRINMCCIDKIISIKKVLKILNETNFSRIPVYNDTRDNIIGLLYAKDLLKYVGKDINSISLAKIVRPAIFVPETKKIDELLKEFKLKKVHMAIAVDEYGGVTGLVTLEDLIEELVGEIYDETDVSKDMIRKVDGRTFVVDGEAEIEDIESVIGVKLSSDDSAFDTVSGLVLDKIGRVPLEGEKIGFKRFTVSIEKMDNQKIISLKIVKK